MWLFRSQIRGPVLGNEFPDPQEQFLTTSHRDEKCVSQPQVAMAKMAVLLAALLVAMCLTAPVAEAARSIPNGATTGLPVANELAAGRQLLDMESGLALAPEPERPSRVDYYSFLG